MLETFTVNRVAVGDWISCEPEEAGFDGTDIFGEVESVSDVPGV